MSADVPGFCFGFTSSVFGAAASAFSSTAVDGVSMGLPGAIGSAAVVTGGSGATFGVEARLSTALGAAAPGFAEAADEAGGRFDIGVVERLAAASDAGFAAAADDAGFSAAADDAGGRFDVGVVERCAAAFAAISAAAATLCAGSWLSCAGDFAGAGERGGEVPRARLVERRHES